jgi:hypothetical protein
MNDFLNFILNRCSVYLLIYFSYMHNALLSTMQIQLKIYIIWLHQFKQNFGTSLLLMFIGLFEWFKFLSNLTNVCKMGEALSMLMRWCPTIVYPFIYLTTANFRDWV